MFSYPEPQNVESAFPVIKETIPRSKLGYNSNNLYPGFPPLMADGRNLIASYQPEAILNNTLKDQNGITSNWEYRKYLIENSEEVLRSNFREACNDVGYFERFLPDERGNTNPIKTTPYQYSSYLDNTNPVGYANSDLKDLYISREQLNVRKFSPSITQDQLFQKGDPR